MSEQVITQVALNHWLTTVFGHAYFSVHPIKGDASSRCYYRVCLAKHSFIVLSSPPQEPLDPFLVVRQLLQDIGLPVPMLFASDKAQGLLLLSDLGSTQYGEAIKRKNRVNNLYLRAFYPVLWMQRNITPDNCPVTLPIFSVAYMMEQLSLFGLWYREKHLQSPLSTIEKNTLYPLFQTITTVVAEQPLVFGHMDYHSRNLMVLTNNPLPGILDFQDAMWAPCTLDLVSLLKDCYVDWPRAQVVQWVRQFYQIKQAQAQGLDVEFSTFLKWFDWTGVQRHLRILGVFCRLHYLHGKSGYLQYIPRILRYLQEMSQTYAELQPLQQFL